MMKMMNQKTKTQKTKTPNPKTSETKTPTKIQIHSPYSSSILRPPIYSSPHSPPHYHYYNSIHSTNHSPNYFHCIPRTTNSRLGLNLQRFVVSFGLRELLFGGGACHPRF
jgi:hypothetical protein